MTVAAEIPLALYDGNGVTVAFPAPWRYPTTEHLLVELIASDGTATPRTLGTHYTATAGATDAGGTVTMVTAPAVGQKLRVRRVTPLAQQTAYPTSGNFPAKSHELALDRLTMIAQEQAGDIDDVQARAMQVPFGEVAPPFPSAAARAGKFIAFDAGGVPVPASGSGADGALRADIAAGNGATLMGLTQSGTPPRGTVAAKLQQIISVKDAPFNATGDGVTDDLAAFNAAAAASNNLFLPEGTYRLSALPTIPDGSFRLIGAGKGTTFLLIDHAAFGGALKIDASSVDDFVELKDFTMLAGASDNRSFVGVWITFPESTSHPYRQVEIDLTWKSDPASVGPSWPRTWGRALRLTNVWYPLIKGNGSSAPVPGEPGNIGFLEVTGGSYGMIAATIDVVWYYGADFIRGSAYIETVNLSRSEAVGVTRGIYVPNTTPVGGASGLYRAANIWSVNATIAAHDAGMDLDNVFDVQSVGFNMQRWAVPSATNFIGYKLNNCVAPKFIGGSIFANDGSAGVTTKGIEATGANCVYGIISGMTFLNCDTLFTLSSDTSRWTVRVNIAAGSPEAWNAQGTNHDIEWLNASGHVQRLAKTVSTSGLVFSQAGEVGITAAGAATYSAEQFLNDAIFRSGGGVVSDTTPTAAQIIAAMGAPPVGVGKRITINNQNSGTLTLLAGAGVTLVSTTTVATNQCRDYLLRVTSVTPGAEAVRLIGLQTGAV